MNAAEFAIKWIGNTNTERAAAQEHFIDICHMLGVPTPNTDRAGEAYAFEKGANRASGGNGWADVWLRGHFGWEYKGHHKDLEAAYKQLLDYREALENPPLLVVCDLDRFIIRTNFTNTLRQEHTFRLEDLRDRPAEPLRILRALFDDPETLRPHQTRAHLTEEAAGAFADLAEQLRDAGHEPARVAHFLNKLLFVLFAEDAKLLPAQLMEQLDTNLRTRPSDFTTQLAELFKLMSTKPGGAFGVLPIQWFNGGLFDGPDVLPLTTQQIEVITRASRLDWSQIEPAIFGTLFERGLDPDKRSQLGAHYTDRVSIERIVYPVLIEPLIREWDAVREDVAHITAGVDLHQRLVGTAKAMQTRAAERVTQFLTRLNEIRVLDPACGSGNFLYVALQSLKDFERQVILWESDTLLTPMRFPSLGPHNVLGIELNSFAAELARVTIWIGEIQWMISNGFAYVRDPVLRPLTNIECRDAVLELSDPAAPQEPEWPTADFIIGNPPFLGGNKIRQELGDQYVGALFKVYEERIPHFSDLCCYWFEKAHKQITTGKAMRAGLLATNSIRGGVNRVVLQRIKQSGDIFMAWADRPWVLDGAAVRVSMVGFDDGQEMHKVLDGQRADSINADLTMAIDLIGAESLKENALLAFEGTKKGGLFEIPEEVAHRMLTAPLNPNGRPNADVVKPWASGADVVRRPRRLSIIDFGVAMMMDEAALYELPFEYVREKVEPQRLRNSASQAAKYWWLHERPRPAMREALANKQRFVATVRHSRHRLFVWLSQPTLPDSALVVFARDDDYFFGVLHSHAHEAWSLRMGTWLGVGNDPRYTPTTCFETFPFPWVPGHEPTGDSRLLAIAGAARELNERREVWLNPEGMVPADRKDRTLTNLYNQRPTWLINAHERLDRAVYAAYGWPYPLDDQEILRGLLQLNSERAAASGGVMLSAEIDEEDGDE